VGVTGNVTDGQLTRPINTSMSADENKIVGGKFSKSPYRFSERRLAFTARQGWVRDGGGES
tara:strand:- start:3364 stop:3546 length:183 start_codon:yes stop_codon:yes gene_type:complete